jgi:ribose transport system ATP-binding protein
MENISKEFPGVKALDDVSIKVMSSEVHALLGENGAGKSTLIKILCGVYHPDRGKIYLRGEDVHIRNIRQAQQMGISIIFQEINICPHLSVADNIFNGRQKNKFGIVDKKAVEADAQKILDRLNLKMKPSEKVMGMGIAQRQLIEIAKAISFHSDVIVFDEPTAALSNEEIENLFKIIRQLKAEGKGIIFISHRMEELKHIVDTVTVLRDGKQIGDTFTFASVTMDNLIEKMVGREIKAKFPVHKRTIGDIFFEVEEVQNRKVHAGAFNVRKGEIVGISGLMGSGRTELARALFGADTSRKLVMKMHGKPLVVRHPEEAINQGIGYLTEDRKSEGLALRLDCEKNINMASLRKISIRGLVNVKQAVANANKYVEALQIKLPSILQLARFLSGGNQQKVIIAKWLCRKVDLIIFDEPTRGIDVGAKYEIYKLMNKLSDEGIGILMISSDISELFGMTDRLLFMYEGSLIGEAETKNTTQEEVLQYIMGIKKAHVMLNSINEQAV